MRPPFVFAYIFLLACSCLPSSTGWCQSVQEFASFPENEDRPAAPTSISLTPLVGKASEPRWLEDLKLVESVSIDVVDQVRPAVVAIQGGSGVIIDRTGYIVTASHVPFAKGRTVNVRLSNGVTWPAVTQTVDKESDLAIVKLIGEQAWPFVPMANSSNLKQGDWIVGFGYPLTFRRGAPSAVRMGTVTHNTPNRIVSTCVIMGGDSGGPVVNLDGQLVGISSRIKKDIRENYHVPANRILTLLKMVGLKDHLVLKNVPSKLSPRLPLSNSQKRIRREELLTAIKNAPMFDEIRDAVVKVTDGEHAQAGTMVSPMGIVVTKASRIQQVGQVSVEINGTSHPCRQIGYRPDVDLCLLEITPESSEPTQHRFSAITFSARTNYSKVGQWVFSLDRNRPVMGVVAVKPQIFLSLGADSTIDFGFVVKPKSSSIRKGSDGRRYHVTAATIDRIYPRSIAARNHLQVGELVFRLGNDVIENQGTVERVSKQTLTSQTKVPVSLWRDGKVTRLSLDISDPQRPNILDRWDGGPFSLRRFDFGNVICHDGPISPASCGGPLFDKKGDVLGINIARSTRVSSFAIPIETVKAMLIQFRPQATIRVRGR